MLIKYLLEPALKKCKNYKQIKAHMILSVWDKTVGEKIAKISNAHFFKNGVLFIEVKNSSWMYELTCLKRDLAAKLNAALGKDIIKDIRFSIVNFKNKTILGDAGAPEVPALAKLSPEEIAQIDETVKDLKDDKLRRKIKSVMAQDKQNQAAKKAAGFLTCKTCGVLFKDKGDICPFCRLKKLDDDKTELADILRGKPWLSYVELKKGLPQISKENYFIIKTNIIEKYYYKLGTLSKKKKLNSEEVNALLNFVMLKTETPLEKLDYKMCEKALGRNLCEHLKDIFGSND